jgi:hypothetical protein
MKSRFAVSVLFILIASTFTSDASAAFKKLRSWACNHTRCVVEMRDRNTTTSSAPKTARQGNKDGAPMIHFDGSRLVLSQNRAAQNQQLTEGIVSKLVGFAFHLESFKFITNATMQIREALDVMFIK